VGNAISNFMAGFLSKKQLKQMKQTFILIVRTDCEAKVTAPKEIKIKKQKKINY
jgi:hypothetical protein